MANTRSISPRSRGPGERRERGEWRKPVAFLFHGIGDALLALPALRALEGLFPDRLALVCDGVAHEVLGPSLQVRRVALLKPAYEEAGSNDPRIVSFDAAGVAAELDGCDLFISLVPWRSPSLDALIERLRPHATIGMAEGYDVGVRRSPERHAFDFAFALPRILEGSLRVERFSAPPALAPGRRAGGRGDPGAAPAARERLGRPRGRARSARASPRSGWVRP